MAKNCHPENSFYPQVNEIKVTVKRSEWFVLLQDDGATGRQLIRLLFVLSTLRGEWGDARSLPNGFLVDAADVLGVETMHLAAADEANKLLSHCSNELVLIRMAENQSCFTSLDCLLRQQPLRLLPKTSPPSPIPILLPLSYITDKSIYNRVEINQILMNEPIIEEEPLNKPPTTPSSPLAPSPPIKLQAKQQAEVKIQQKRQDGFMEVRIGDQTLFTLPPEMQQQQHNLVYRQRRTRWGERQIKRSKIQEDAVFNPLETLYHGKTLLPITQYGQADLEIKLSLYSDGKRRKSKWAHEIEKTFNPPLLNYVSPNISVDQLEYILRLYRLDELASQMTNYTPDDPDLRSPSPEPIYDNQGKRINTREVRKRDTFIRERIALIEDCMKMRKSFVPPEDYKPLKKFKKIYLSENAIQDSKANYIGKIIGPRGQTQKLIEQRSGCKIAVRGRGANKAQKDIFENFEPLHIIIVADSDDQLERGVEEVEKILNGEEDQELKDLLDSYNYQIQGVYDNFCDNCQIEGHRTWACPFQPKSTVVIKCSICGENSHPTSDCPEKQAYLKKQQTDQIAMLLESQYSQFKEDLTSKKPKGGANFITDFDHKKDLLAITAATAAAEAQKGAAVKKQPERSSKMVDQKIIESSDLPKFEDD